MIEIDPQSPVPLYLQIAEQVRRLIALGALAPGERIPTVRELAGHARVNRNTAARAIQHLETQGLVRSRVGQGTFVEDRPAVGAGGGAANGLDDRLDRLVVEAHTLGVPLEELGARLDRRIKAFRRSRRDHRGAASSGDTE